MRLVTRLESFEEENLVKHYELETCCGTRTGENTHKLLLYSINFEQCKPFWGDGLGDQGWKPIGLVGGEGRNLIIENWCIGF
jgi:hypothetical protein